MSTVNLSNLRINTEEGILLPVPPKDTPKPVTKVWKKVIPVASCIFSEELQERGCLDRIISMANCPEASKTTLTSFIAFKIEKHLPQMAETKAYFVKKHNEYLKSLKGLTEQASLQKENLQKKLENLVVPFARNHDESLSNLSEFKTRVLDFYKDFKALLNQIDDPARESMEIEYQSQFHRPAINPYIEKLVELHKQAEVANALTDDRVKSDALAGIVKELSMLKDYKKIQEIILILKELDYGTSALHHECIVKLVDEKAFAEAKEIAKLIPKNNDWDSDHYISCAYSHIAEGLAKEGLFKEACEALQSIRLDELKTVAIMSILSGQIWETNSISGEEEENPINKEMLFLITLIPDEIHRNALLTKCVALFLDRDQLAEAMEAAELITDTYYQITSYERIAKKWLAKDNFMEAMATTHIICRLEDGDLSTSQAISLYMEIIEKMDGIDRLEECKKMLDAIPREKIKHLALGIIAVLLALKGKSEEASEIIHSIGTDEARLKFEQDIENMMKRGLHL